MLRTKRKFIHYEGKYVLGSECSERNANLTIMKENNYWEANAPNETQI